MAFDFVQKICVVWVEVDLVLRYRSSTFEHVQQLKVNLQTLHDVHS